MKYPIHGERVTFEDVTVKKRRKRLCAARRLPYAWMRFDTCTELPDPDKEVPAVSDARSVSTFLHEAVPFAGRNVEFFMVLCLDNKNKPIAAVPHRGGRASLTVDPAIVLQAALLAGSSSIILAHNHPSEDPKPSQEDMALTQRLKEASKLVGIGLLDHVILTDYPESYYSFTDSGILR